jgi:hypothetical protein
MPAIPYAPDISPPYEMTPEELAEWLRKLASQGQGAGQGGGAFGGEAMSPAGTSYEQYGISPPEEPVVDPRLVQKFMQFQQQSQPSLSGSAGVKMNEAMGTEGQAGPITEDQLNMLRPPNVYDLPQDETLRQSFRAMDKAATEEYKGRLNAESLKADAEAARTRAEASLLTAKTYAENPALLAKNQFVGSELLDAGVNRGGGNVPVPVAEGAPGIPTVPLGQEDQNINIPEGGGGMPNFSRMAENAQIGQVFGPKATPQKEIPQNYRPKKGGDIGAFYRSGSQIWVWDGQSYQRYQ